MVYLILTRAGLEQVRPRLQPRDVVWAGKSALSSQEAAALRTSGVDVTIASRDIDPADAAAIASWTYSVAGHYPGEPLWVEEKDDAEEAARKTQRSVQAWICAALVLIFAVVFLAIYFVPYVERMVGWRMR